MADALVGDTVLKLEDEVVGVAGIVLVVPNNRLVDVKIRDGKRLLFANCIFGEWVYQAASKLQ
jgi:hypothetical protein